MRYARSQVIENHRNHNARTANTRFTVTDERVDADAFLPLQHLYILPLNFPLIGRTLGSDHVQQQMSSAPFMRTSFAHLIQLSNCALDENVVKILGTGLDAAKRLFGDKNNQGRRSRRPIQ